MCGIVGIIHKNKTVEKSLLQGMLDAVAHRGPEDAGVWSSKTGLVGLGHRRLAIIDLSPLGHQPMVSSDGQLVITFNGEIYNFQELKTELSDKGYTFQSQSDTEVLLCAYKEWGSDMLGRLNGMFAFAIWDEKKQYLFAARDRLGEKPFKYYVDDEVFLFASELKALLKYTGIPKEIDWQAVDLALSYRYVPSPLTGFKNIKKLPPGHFLIFERGNATIIPYWQPRQFAQVEGVASIDSLKVDLWNLFKDSVKKRMISDVPVGAFLSGGLDSSSVVAAMAEISSKVKTFSVGFKDRPDSETPFAKLVAERFQTDHTELIIDPDIIAILPKLVYQYEEPFFDNSAVPTMAMSEITKQHVTVVLTGDGGDECFGGYPNYLFFKYLNLYQKLPKVVYKKCIPKILKTLWKVTRQRAIGKQFYRSELLSHSLYQAYVDYYAIWQKELVQSKFYLSKKDLYTPRFAEEVDSSLDEQLMQEWLGDDGLVDYGSMNRAMLGDISSRLSEDYLMKVDFGAMSFALETRPPFLDHRLVEKALHLPETLKVRGGEVKWIWKQVVKDKLPSTILTRKKMGFGIPIGHWMRNELYSFVKDKLLSASPLFYEYCQKSVVSQLIEEHKQGHADYSNHIWSLLLLEEWMTTFFKDK